MRCLKAGTRRDRPRPARPDDRESRDSCAGAVLLDILLAAIVLTVGILNVVLTATKCSDLQQATAAYIQAHNTSRGILEQIRNGDLATQLRTFSEKGSFSVRGQQVAVHFPADMLEDVHGGAIARTARFRDLDADGEVEFDETSTDNAGLLPVRVIVTQGSSCFRLESLLTKL